MATPEQLTEWSRAERLAVQAEELARIAVENHFKNGDPLPSLDMQRLAHDRRSHADKLFQVIYASALETEKN